MHRSRFAGLIIDCRTSDLEAAAAFWSAALGTPERGDKEPKYVSLDMPEGEPHIQVQQVDHPSRVHLDIESDDIPAEVARLEALGARKVADIRTWCVMEAPTGQRFCIVPAAPASPRKPTSGRETAAVVIRMTPDAYRIALAAPGHLPEIPKIEQAAASVFAAEDLPPSLRYRVTDREYLHEAQHDGRLWVALEGRRPVGFALADVADGEAYLSEIDVHPEHARRGLGTRLVRAVVDWAAARGFDNVLLVTFRHLPWNAPFYAKLGFVALPDPAVGPELRGFIAEEGSAGIDTSKRVAMRLPLPRPAHGETA